MHYIHSVLARPLVSLLMLFPGSWERRDFIKVIYLCQAWKWTESSSSSSIKDGLIVLLPFKWLNTVVHIRPISSELLQRVDSPWCLFYRESMIAAERKEQRLYWAWETIRRVSKTRSHGEWIAQLVDLFCTAWVCCIMLWATIISTPLALDLRTTVDQQCL